MVLWLLYHRLVDVRSVVVVLLRCPIWCHIPAAIYLVSVADFNISAADAIVVPWGASTKAQEVGKSTNADSLVEMNLCDANKLGWLWKIIHDVFLVCPSSQMFFVAVC